MLDATRKVSEYTEGLDAESFWADSMVQDAVLRNLEIIGEAAKRVPDAIRDQASEISWREVCGFRDVIVHDYDAIDLEVVWDVIANEVPGLLESLEILMEDLSDSVG